MYRLTLALSLALATSAFAQTPPGHPKVDEADRALHNANATLPNKGKVLETMNAGGYTYLLVSDAGKERWVAVNQIDVKPEDFVRYSEGMLMDNFHSKALDRTFDEILFVSNIVIEGSHPTVNEAAQILDIPASGDQLPNEGKVVSTIPSNAYTYIEVEQKGVKSWLAVPRVSLEDGTLIRYGNGTVMKNFYSRKLSREFPEVIFLGGVQVVQ